MPERIAVVGAKRGVDLDKVTGFLTRLHGKSPDTVIVSGGLNGTDETAEKHWLGLGGKVLSYRPYMMTSDSFCVQELGLAPLCSRIQPTAKIITKPTWADQDSATRWCLRLIIQRSDRVVCFLPDGQVFTEVEDYCLAEEKPFYAGASV
jgi:hypothetical protein